MFTGLIETLGQVRALTAIGGDVRIEIAASDIASPDWFASIAVGDSVAVSGVCLTALAPTPDGFSADVSSETLRLTSLGALQVGALVNLERALLPTTRMGGHMVSGHVDALGAVRDIRSDGRAQAWQFSAPIALMRFIAVKGSIAVNGVSLTVNSVQDGPDHGIFGVHLIPHTLAATDLGALKIGDPVNLEVDLIARYLDRLRAV